MKKTKNYNLILFLLLLFLGETTCFGNLTIPTSSNTNTFTYSSDWGNANIENKHIIFSSEDHNNTLTIEFISKNSISFEGKPNNTHNNKLLKKIRLSIKN